MLSSLPLIPKVYMYHSELGISNRCLFFIHVSSDNILYFSAFLTAQLNDAMKAGTALWTGLKHGSATGSKFFDDDDTYVWSSNQDVSYTNWNHGEPNGLNNVRSTPYFNCVIREKLYVFCTVEVLLHNFL